MGKVIIIVINVKKRRTANYYKETIEIQMQSKTAVQYSYQATMNMIAQTYTITDVHTLTSWKRIFHMAAREEQGMKQRAESQVCMGNV